MYHLAEYDLLVFLFIVMHNLYLPKLAASGNEIWVVKMCIFTKDPHCPATSQFLSLPAQQIMLVPSSCTWYMDGHNKGNISLAEVQISTI